jgi:hypothetical protein
MTKVNRNRGKVHERRTALTLGGKRRGVLGGEDVEHKHFSIECKSRQNHGIYKWWQQTNKNNKENKIPLLCIHQHNKNYKEDLIVLSIEEFAVMYEFLKREGYFAKN